MTRKRKWLTADELLADPTVQAQQPEAMRKIREGEEFDRQEQASLRSELAAIGVTIDVIWDLVNTRETYDAAVPILMKHLKQPYSAGTREGIARALTVRAAKPFARELLELFKTESDNSSHSVKWAIGNALTVASVPKMLPDIIKVALDPSHGEARTSLVVILGRSKRSEAKKALMRLVAEPGDVGLWAKKYVMRDKSPLKERN